MYYVYAWNAYVRFREDKGRQIAVFLAFFTLNAMFQYVRAF